jgi:long-chain fatty acid transport protein
MKTNNAVTNAWLAVAIAVSGLLAVGGARAAGFALMEQSTSSLGNAFAGASAVAEDVSTMYFNPAGLTRLPGVQAAAAVHGIDLSAECANCVSTRPPALGGGMNTGGNGGNAGGVAAVPNLYIGVPIGNRWALGLGVNAPFGLKTEYDSGWTGRFQGITTDLKTINFNPAVAFKVSDSFSLGAGVNYQKAEAELTNRAVVPGVGEANADLEVDDWAWGWNVGLLWQLSQDMRIGASYRSAINYALEGNLAVTTLGGAPIAAASGPTSVDIKFPDMASLSIMQVFGDKWELLGDVTFTHWSVIDTVNAINSTNGSYRDKLTFDFDNTWRIALGVNYLASEQWKIRGGFAWDQSPVNDSNRTVRLPDNDRYWFSLGAQWKFAKAGALDVGYAYLLIPGSEINFTRSQVGPNGVPVASTSTTVTGSYSGSVNILSAQLTWTF